MKIVNYVKEVGVELALFVSILAVTGSLFVSEILGWSPCRLCLYQRVFMYPLVGLLGAALVVGHRRIWQGSVLFAVVGASVSLYHHLIVLFDPTQGCGYALPCSMDYQLNLGFFVFRPMYLPLLAFVAFVLIAVLVWSARR